MRHATMIFVLFSLSLIFFSETPAKAQIPISGDLFDGAGGPLQSGLIYHVNGFIRVPDGETLTVEAGAIVKFGASDFLSTVGTLIVEGGGAPAIFTSLSDDTAGGDTNSDGPSVGTPGDWLQLTFSGASDLSQIQGAEIRFAGTSGFSAIQLLQADISITGTTIEKCAGAALALNGDSRPTVTQCTFDECTKAVVGVRLDGVPNFSANSASGNSVSNAMELLRGGIEYDVVVTSNNVLNGALVCPVGIEVQSGLTLTLSSDVVIKFTTGPLFFTVHGTLFANGLPGAPVVLTSIADDDYAGDTNNDGPSDGGITNFWSSLQFTSSSDASQLTHCVVRYAGFANFPGVSLNQADITLKNCWVAGCASMGLFLGLNSFPSVIDCAFDENDLPITGLTWSAVPGFFCNTAEDNVTGDYMLVTGVIGGIVSVTPENYPGDVIVSTGTLSSSGGDDLTINAGVIVKMPAAGFVNAEPSGAIHILGTGQRPVVFTSLLDDSVGGDTNKDGTTTNPFPGVWSKMAYFTSASPSEVRNLVVRYAGRSFFSAFSSSSPNLIARAIRVEHCAGPGIEISDLASDLRDCTAYSCGGDGLVLRNKSFDVVGATSANNGGIGINILGLYAGQVRNSIAWNNSSAQVSGASAANFFYSNGSAALNGINGNIFLDPQFQDLNGPDLRISTNSPCVEAGDPQDAPSGPDALGFPRFLDGDLDRSQRIDMGAHEFGHVSLGINSDGVPGSTVTLTSSGTPGSAALMFIGLGQGEVPVTPYGSLFLNLSLPFFILSWPSVPSAVPLSIPGNVDGLEITFQEISLLGGSGNFSNSITLKIGCPQ